MEHTHASQGSVVVGVDGSEDSTRAVRWAAHQAAARGLPLTLLHASGPFAVRAPWWIEAYGIDPDSAREQLRRRDRRLLEAAVRLVRTELAGLEVREVVEDSDPRDALLDASHGADTVVVGSRGLGPVRGLVLGSTSSALCHGAACPVVVAFPETGEQPRREVLVGADGTAESRPVLEYAFRQASFARRPLTVVHAYWDANRLYADAQHLEPDPRGPESLRVLLAESVAGLQEEFPDVEVDLQLSCGLVDSCLAAAGTTAALVVVGRHRRGALSRLVTGSVADAVLGRASCPVAVVPEASTREAAPVGRARRSVPSLLHR